MSGPYPYHPLANLFPLIEGKDFDEFCAGLLADGRLHDRIILFEGQVLDGRNRQRACEATGITAHYRTFNPEIEGDPLKFVISKNLHRRHLTSSQRAMLAADIETYRHGDNQHQGGDANLHVLREDAAEIAGASPRSVASAAKVRDEGTPELQDAVRQDKVAVSTAAEIASLPGPEQTKVLALSDKEIVARARAIREAKQAEKKAKRTEREADLGQKQTALPDKRFGVILADPEWRFEPYSRDTGMDRAADNHYPTSTTDVIASRPVASIAAEDCVLFLWATVPMLPDALKVMEAWGFTYKSHVVWAKDKVGTGYWFRNQHEVLLLGTRGNVPAPAPGTQWHSLPAGEVREHSRKPDWQYEIVEEYFPSLPRIELNARSRRQGWDAWGLEAPDQPVDANKVISPHDPDTGEILDPYAPGNSSALVDNAMSVAKMVIAGIGANAAAHAASPEGGSHVTDRAIIAAGNLPESQTEPAAAPDPKPSNVIQNPREVPFGEVDEDGYPEMPAFLRRTE